MQIKKLTTKIGAEVTGVDFSKPLTSTEKIDLKNALIDNYVLFFRDQILDPEYLPTVISQFGKLLTLPGEPKYKNNSNIGYFVSDENTDVSMVEGQFMHADRTCMKTPPRTSMLYITECPDVGGDTVFSNVAEAYKFLRREEKNLLSKLNAIHMAPSILEEEVKEDDITDFIRKFRYITSHPVIMTRPETEEKIIYVNEVFTDRILLTTPIESHQTLLKLFSLISNPMFSCRFKWTPNTIAWWDNLGTQHQAIWDYYPSTRIGHRVLSQNLY